MARRRASARSASAWCRTAATRCPSPHRPLGISCASWTCSPAFSTASVSSASIIPKSGKRLGDIAAGTLVVHEQRALGPSAVRSAPERRRSRRSRRDSPRRSSRCSAASWRGARSSSRGCATFTSQIAGRFREHLTDDVRAADGAAPTTLRERRAIRARADSRRRARRARRASATRSSPSTPGAGAISRRARPPRSARGLRAMSPEEVSSSRLALSRGLYRSRAPAHRLGQRGSRRRSST